MGTISTEWNEEVLRNILPNFHRYAVFIYYRPKCACAHICLSVCVQSLRSGGHREHVNDLSNFVELSEDEAVVREQQKNAD